MSKEVYVFEVTEDNFDVSVLDNSHKIPVVVAFMGMWSEHCIAVESIFTVLAEEFASEFIFAKVDIDERPQLRERYKIEHVPTVIVFQNGDAVRAELGALDENEARVLLRDFGVVHESDLLREQAREKHLGGDTPAAIMLLTEAIQKHPTNTRVALDMVQIFIDVNQLENAEGLFNRLPERDRSSDVGRSLNDQLLFAKAAAKTDGLAVLSQRVVDVPDDKQAKFDLALCLMAQHEPAKAMDQLLTILERDLAFKENAAKEMLLSIIRMFKETDPELAQEYQRRLSNLLAK